MRESNAELARRGFQALAEGDLDAVGALLDPDVKWHGGDPSAGGACRNRSEAIAFMARAQLGELVEVIAAGDRVVVVLQPAARSGGLPPLRANVTTFRDGRVVEIVAFESPEQALAAAQGGPQSGVLSSDDQR